MRKSLLRSISGALVAAVILFSSCGDQMIKVNFPMKIANITFTMPVTPQAGSLVLSEQTIQTKLDSLLKENKASAEDIKSIILKSFKLELVNGDATTNFKVISAVTAELKSEIKPTFVTIADLPNNPDVEAFTIDMPVNSTVNYKEYLSGNSFVFKASGSSRAPIEKEVTVKAILEFDVEAEL